MAEGLVSVRGQRSLVEEKRLSNSDLLWASHFPVGLFPHLHPEGNEPHFLSGPFWFWEVL